MGNHLAKRAGLTPADWHHRFRQQADWTAELRRHLYAQLNPGGMQRILEVGCGTGAITADLHSFTRAAVMGLDRDLPLLRHAARQDPTSAYAGGNALRLPFADDSFDLVLCHFFLLWVGQPAAALAEMSRVTRPGGWVLALAEPDYGARIDHPAPLAALGRLQGELLQQQGADTTLGRRLAGLFLQAGLGRVQAGLLGGQWGQPPAPEAWESEWAMLEHDLQGTVPPAELHHLRQLDAAAWQHGERILFVPTFHACGQK